MESREWSKRWSPVLKTKQPPRKGMVLVRLLISYRDIYNVSKFLEKNIGCFWLEFNH